MTSRLTPKIANEIALKAMMASNAYRPNPNSRGLNRTQFPVENLEWKRVDLSGHTVPDPKQSSYYPKSSLGKTFSSLQFDIWENKVSSETIIAFKGTDEKIDWIVGNFAAILSIPYKSAKKKVREYCDRNPRREVSLTGHSLGGGIALSVSAWLGLPALVFNSSPRVFDGWKNMNQPAVRQAVFQQGDFLQYFRVNRFKFLEKVPATDIIETRFDYGGESNHRMDLLAEGIVRAANDPLYVNIANNIRPKFKVPPM